MSRRRSIFHQSFASANPTRGWTNMPLRILRFTVTFVVSYLYFCPLLKSFALTVTTTTCSNHPAAILDTRDTGFKVPIIIMSHNDRPQDPSSKKRPRNDDKDETFDVQKLLSLISPLQKLRLEAIFHPKFENEKSNHQIRQEMTNLVENQSGYLEVTLKHSGSLVLWSGGQRYYSKNSLCNSFTLVAEILLRQHMERAWPNEGHQRYEECSRYLENHRLTCSFEVVTAVLGDHGDTPQRDFLILTAVADRSTERFYSTAQLVQLAHQFRLPHNDAWAFTNASSATKLFELYDQSRESGLASDIIAALSKTAQVHIASMYPHSIFQGEILEGFVVRYIPYPKGPDGLPSQMQEYLQNLAIQSQDTLLKVPPTLPSTFEYENSSHSELYKTNVRAVFKSVNGPKKGTSAMTDFAKALEDILAIADKGQRRSVHRPSGGKPIDLPSLTRGLDSKEMNNDRETQRIAELLQTLSNLNKAVTYTMVQEQLPNQREQVSRILCVIHVHGDQTFLKFQNSKTPEAMNLFRGFCIELNGSDDATTPSLTDTMTTPMDCDEEQQRDADAPFLMLKMKLLPYMVRTFLCRNPLNILQQQGPLAYIKVCKNLLDKWSISSQGKTRWIPFLEQWAIYAKSRMDHPQYQSQDHGDLPPLNSFSYLQHLEHFRDQWENGKIDIRMDQPGFRGMVCLVAPTIQSAQSGAERLAKALGGANVMSLAEAEERWVTTGVISYEIIDEQKKRRDFLKDTSDYLVVVMYGCSPEEIQAELQALPPETIKASIGHCRSWDKQLCHTKLNLAKTSMEDFNANPDFQEAIEKIKQAAELVPDVDSDSDSSPGLFIYFPGIPGCGKSSLVDSIAGELEKRLGESCCVARTVHVLVGDELGKLFWNTVKATRQKNQSSIMIADKNTPPPSWSIVGTTCSATRAFPVAVFPDPTSLKTTRILGSRKPDGSFDPDKSHFYPFSLQYLAICLARVLRRPPSSHLGKLDSGSPLAAMLVIMFYSFYRYKSAEELQDLIDMKLKAADAMDSLEPIRVPSLADGDMDLPTEVVETLTEALQLQLGYDNGKRKLKISDKLVQEMEEKLRLCISEVDEYLLSKTVALDTSRESFMEQVVQRVQIIDSGDKENGNSKTSIKLVSIDVPLTQVHRIIKEQEATGILSAFLKMCMEQEDEVEWWDQDHYKGVRFVQNTHITMRFWQETTQSEMKEQFLSLLGASVEIKATALLWDEAVAALELIIPEATMDGRALPASKNEFVHITIWVAKDAKASMSNRLPDRWKKGEAQRVEFASPITTYGSISFWDFENNPIPAEEN